MKVGFYNIYDEYNGNRMFTSAASPIGDDLAYPFVYLRKYFEERGHRISTIDTEDVAGYDAIVFLGFPGIHGRYFRESLRKKPDNLYLIVFENELIRPVDWRADNHRYFKKVFTWHDDYIDNRKYFKIQYPQNIPASIEADVNGKTTLCTLIAGNKSVKHPNELYSERIKAIRWFEENHPDEFAFYGIGWDRYCFSGQLRHLNRFEWLTKRLGAKYPSYRGRVASKKEIFRKYRFAICYENARDIPGYITEKIFDCLFAGCVPVYWGAPNITDFVHENVFIDRRKFGTIEEVYTHIRTMGDDAYRGYLENIRKFVQGDMIQVFSAEAFAKTLAREIIDHG